MQLYCNKHTIPVGDVHNWGAMYVWGMGVYGKSLYLTINFTVNIKLLWNIFLNAIVFCILTFCSRDLLKFNSSSSLILLNFLHKHSCHLQTMTVLFLPYVCSVVSDSLRSPDCSPPGSSGHGVFQAGILEWVAIFFSRTFSQPRSRNGVSCVSCIGGWVLYYWATWGPFISSFSDSYIIFLSLPHWLESPVQ